MILFCIDYFGRICAIPNTNWGKNVLKSQIFVKREAFSCPPVVQTLQWINVQLLQWYLQTLKYKSLSSFISYFHNPNLVFSTAFKE